jgi:serine/threonine protein phosphatase PrpC
MNLVVNIGRYYTGKADMDEAKTKLIDMGFTIEETRELVMVKAADAGRTTLLEKLNSGSMSIYEFFSEAEKLYEKPNHKIIKTKNDRIIKSSDYDIVGDVLLPTRDIKLNLNYTKDKKVIQTDKIILSFRQSENKQSVIKQTEPPVKDSREKPAPKEEEVVYPRWRDLPPADQEDWVEINDSAFKEWNGWGICAASRRGKTHAHEGSHRDDSFGFDFENGWSILAAADGAGSCRLSRVGSKIGCEMAVKTLKQFLKDYKVKQIEGVNIPEETDLIRIRTFLVDTMHEVLISLKEEAAARKIEFDLLSTTMLIAVHREWMGKSLIASIQVGDGAIALWHGGVSVSILGVADSGEYASETKFITTKDIEKEFEHKVFFAIKPEVDAVAIMTDGISDDFFPVDTMMPKMFEYVYQIVLGENPADKLVDWLGYEKRGSFDDRTIVFLHRR